MTRGPTFPGQASNGPGDEIAGIQKRLRDLAGSPEDVSAGELEALVARLLGLSKSADFDAWGDATVAHERQGADENLVLAVHDLRGGQRSVADAIAHLLCAADLLARAYGQVVEDTREIDRRRNALDFMSG